MSNSEPLNPYASPEILAADESDAAAEIPGLPRATSLPVIALRWTLVCSIAAAPSFFFGYSVTRGQWLAMILGILCFIGLYIAVDFNTQERPWRQNKLVRGILMFCYGTRIAISIIFPIGATVDMFAGLISVSLVDGVFNIPRNDGPTLSGFLPAFATTLVQGFVLNLLLLALATLCLMVISFYQFLRPQPRPLSSESLP